MQNYHFEDFTLEAYESLLIQAKEHYNFVKYDQSTEDSDCVFWRHDVDLSMEDALVIAEIENKHDVQSTYFLLLHTNFYNLLDHRCADIARRISELGHEIGVHFDPEYYLPFEQDLDHYLGIEAQIFEDLLGVSPKVFSFHNTTEFILTCEADKYAGLVNTFSRFFREEVGFFSDSNGFWRYGRLKEELPKKKHSRLQVLTHPGWWQGEIAPPRQRIKRIVERDSENVLKAYDETLERFSRKNINL